MYSIDSYHLKKADENTKIIFNEFLKITQSFGPILIEPLKSIITLKKHSQFCAITIQKKTLKIVFRMYSAVGSPRFNRTSQQMDMMYYEMYIRSIEELDPELIFWLKSAYEEN